MMPEVPVKALLIYNGVSPPSAAVCLRAPGSATLELTLPSIFSKLDDSHNDVWMETWLYKRIMGPFRKISRCRALGELVSHTS